MIYYKRYTGRLLPQKTAEQPSQAQWTHHSEGKTHCEECLTLDGCWFQGENAPFCPHHPCCHYTLDPIPYVMASMNTASHGDYSKFDPYLFDPENIYRHGKNRAFESWGYSALDSMRLKNQSERQALEKYLSGGYMLGKLDRRGQRVGIRVTILRKGKSGSMSFIIGWMPMLNGKLKLNTPYGGK